MDTWQWIGGYIPVEAVLLANSREMFLRLLDVVRGVDHAFIEQCRASRHYEELERYVLAKLMGKG